MVDVNVDFIFESEQPINADFQLEPDVTYTADIMLSSASSFHNELYNRDLPDQHPMGAITGLEDALSELNTADEQLEQAIADEATARQNADITLQENITAENNRAVEAEEALDNKIDSEADTRADEITRVEGLISDEETRASEAETTLQTNITAEKNRAIEVETQIINNLSTEVNRLDVEDARLNQKIDTETQRAKTIEAEISANLVTEKTAREQGDSILSNAITEEQRRAEQAESELSDKIDTVEDDLTEDIDSLATIVDNNYNTLDTRITNVADELGQQIEENVVALQQEDTALQNQINAHSQTLTSHDTRITNNANAIIQEATDRQSADDVLQDQIDTLSARGRFLSLWDATTGLPESTPQINPYIYKTGDYFIVDKVGEVNYRPTGTEYVIGQASTEVETEELATDDVYYFDGVTWHLQINHGKTVSFANLAGSPDDNIALKTALDNKQPIGDYATNTALTQGLATKADDSDVVHKTGNETIAGNKDFTGTITAVTPVTSDNSTKVATTAFVKAQSYATTEMLNSKQDVITDLDDIRNNISTNTSNISYLDEKVRDIELFKFPNAVIIGEPTISNGQVSGFSANNYMQFPFILDLHNTPFQIDFAFTTGNNVTTQQNILDSEFGLALAIANGKGLMAISGNGTSWNIGSSVGTINILPNTTYYARLTWDGMQYKTLISTNGIDYTQDMYLVGTQRPYPRTIFIGGCSGSAIGHTPHPFLGSINMNKSYLSTRGQVIWQGMDDAGLATRADISLSNLDEVGEKRFNDLQDDIDTRALSSEVENTYLKKAQQGVVLPNFDVMPVIATYEYDVATTTYQQLFTRTNTETKAIDLQDIVYCRIYVTGTNINAKYDCAFLWKGRENSSIQILAFSYPGTTDYNLSGIRYIRSVHPKALNNGYQYIVDFQTYNTTARHIKVEVFKTNSKITWMSTATNTTYSSTGHNTNQCTLAINYGICGNDTFYWGYVNNATWAGSINTSLSKYTTNNAMPYSGAALLANQFTFMNGNKIYPATNKTLAIEPSFGIVFNNAAYNNNVAVGWDRFKEKVRINSLTNIPHATLARGENCYFRCTTDENGNIYSDNYVTNEMTPGYTWYYVGLAESNTAICICTTNSHFLTLDTDGKLTAVDGKVIAVTTEMLNSKQDKLTAGDNITIENNVISSAGGAVDNKSITKNTDNQIQAVGTINQNTAVGATPVKYDWIGTLAEYNSQNVETLHPEWVCYITDDVSGGESVYTKAEVDSAISTALTAMLDNAFPVGYRYITEASTCPLATLIPNSTWVLTSQGRVIQGADSNHASGTTAEAGLPNIEGSTNSLAFNGTDDNIYPNGDATGLFANSFRFKNNAQVAIYTSENPTALYLMADASLSNPIYGNSTTVQPPAEFVNIFKRIL